ncbi:hypothetical protein ARMGADRAFT_1018653 [Armillaria gallica]|uniref:Uncharacterized protein n=1 Tax=Armillaria gallica TaxID=47427 RepID=A0A2H3CYF0_ARMGA|nr:hypothetical protein ARMGADRAFT_1018653 [Armillaria gallica]
MTTNTLPLTRPMLETLLKYLCDQLSNPGSPFHIPSLLLVIHGGAAMLLHPSYQTIPTSRQSTLDVDYLAKPFSEAVRTTITRAITETSRAFPGLGADWMNADADVALPPGVWEGSTHAGNLTQNTIFERGSVRMVSVSPGWAVGLKLMRYEKYDAGDVVVILLNGLRVKGGGKWTQEIVEAWVRAECATMGYDAWPAWKLAEMRVRIRDAVRLVEEWLKEHPGVVTKTIARQTSVMSVQEEAEIREWERKLRREKEKKERRETKPRGRYLLGQWVEPDDSDPDSDSDSDTSTESDGSPTSSLSTTSSYYPPDQHQPSCPYSSPPTRTSMNEPPPLTSPYQPPNQHQSSRPYSTPQTRASPYQPPPLMSPYQPPSQHQSQYPYSAPQSQTSPYEPPPQTNLYQPPNQRPYSTPRSQSSPYQAPNNSPPATQGYIPPAHYSPPSEPPPPSKTPAPNAYPPPPQVQAFSPNFASPIYASPNPGALLSPLNYNMNIPFSTPWIGAGMNTNTNMIGARAGW